MKRRLDALSQMEGKDHTQAACYLRSHGTISRYIIQTKGGALKLDKAKIASEELLMAMVLVGYAEEKTGSNWFSISRTLDDITAWLIGTKSSTLWYTSQISDEAKELFSNFSLKVPGKVLEAHPEV